jgi:lipopolysaccharide/colanic/teichoic acid biosynthesis glycosyltransferase
MITAPVSRSCTASVSKTYDAARIDNPLPGWKRALDVTVLIVTAPVLVPLMAIIALLIKLVSPGPVLFRQERIGLYGEGFHCFKFRTMKVAAETKCHKEHLEKLMNSATPMKKLDDADNRIIPVIGPLLRASGLDELAQVFNILRGEMSIVGPRPCIRYEYEKFSAQDRARFNAVPGLTGLWQVSGKNSTTFRQMIELDVEYSENLSLGQDLSIIFRTFPVVFGQTAEMARRKVSRRIKDDAQ